MKRIAHSVNRGFTTVKRDFTSVERGPTSVKMTFASVKSTFTSVERRNLKYAIPDPVYLGNPLSNEVVATSPAGRKEKVELRLMPDVRLAVRQNCQFVITDFRRKRGQLPDLN